GSADAAAALRALARLRGRALPRRAAQLALGADVPVCVDSRPCRMSGVGAQLAPVPDLPPIWLVLANPGVAVPTARVFGALPHSDGASMPAELPDWEDAAALATWLRGQRNDLETPARGLFPAIGAALGALSGQEGCLIARMSGSGATCFGLFADPPAAMAAAETIARDAPAWWVRAAGLAGPVS
ncbi:4-(cytidine 5'-diphospho)-2-C-methyl-D-erythritol kinase, partial [Rhodobacteraceae bacterium WD3A24]